MTCEEPSTKIYASISNRLETQHQSIQLILATVSTKRLMVRREEDTWNIHDIVAHLVTYQQMHIERISRALSEDEPFFCKHELKDDPDFEYWRTNDLQVLVTQLDIDRQKLIQLINALDEEQLRRIGMHKKYGSHNITQWTEFFLLHEAHHIYNIFQLAYDIELK